MKLKIIYDQTGPRVSVICNVREGGGKVGLL